MASNEKSKMAQRMDGLKSEFAKIVWPTKEAVTKQSVAVIVVSIIVGLLIVLIDMVVQHGVDFLINL